MRMIKAVLLAALLPNIAWAAGEYDGIYQYGLSPAYYSVHQNGGSLLVASMGFMPLNDIVFNIGSYQVAPRSMGFWEYSAGSITGNRARITGVVVFGSCASTSDVTFEASGNATVTFVSTANTAFGTSQGVNCAALYRDITAAIGSTITLRRIF